MDEKKITHPRGDLKGSLIREIRTAYEKMAFSFLSEDDLSPSICLGNAVSARVEFLND